MEKHNYPISLKPRQKQSLLVYYSNIPAAKVKLFYNELILIKEAT